MARAHVASLSVALLVCLAESPAAAMPRDPAWLVPGPGTIARVDIAPWEVADEPEAALTDSAASISHDFTADAERPGDVHYESVGVLVRIERVMPSGPVALVHGVEKRWQAYARIERLVPNVPPGTLLVAAGGFEGFADFYTRLDTLEARAGRLATGSRLVALGTGVAPYDPDSPGLVRLHVRVTSGSRRGSSGWIPVGYTGLPVARLSADADVTERACSCRLIAFNTKSDATSNNSRHR
jgi:hypothetical protein